MTDQPEFLLVVALKTTQHDVQRRLSTILAAMESPGEQPAAEVIAREQPTANDADHLDCLFGYDVAGRLGFQRTAEVTGCP